MKKNNGIKATEENTSSRNDNNNSSFFIEPENNPLHKALIEGIAGVSNIYFEQQKRLFLKSSKDGIQIYHSKKC
jgi:hypothetical protein